MDPDAARLLQLTEPRHTDAQRHLNVDIDTFALAADLPGPPREWTITGEIPATAERATARIARHHVDTFALAGNRHRDQLADGLAPLPRLCSSP